MIDSTKPRSLVFSMTVTLGCFAFGLFALPVQETLAQLNQESKKKNRGVKNLAMLEAEGNTDAILKQYRQISTRLRRQLNDLKLERKLVQHELKTQLHQLANSYADARDEDVKSKALELAYTEVLKVDLEDEKATKYFESKGTLEAKIATLKKAGYPKRPFAKNIQERGLGIPPQEAAGWGKESELIPPAAPGAPKQETPKKAKPKKVVGKSKSKKGKSKQGDSKEKSKTPRKEIGRKISVQKILQHHERQFKAIARQEKNTSERRHEIVTKWIRKMKESIKSGELTDREIKKYYRQIARLNPKDADAKKYLEKQKQPDLF